MTDLTLATLHEISNELRRRGRSFILAAINTPEDAPDKSNQETASFYWHKNVTALGLVGSLEQYIVRYGCQIIQEEKLP